MEELNNKVEINNEEVEVVEETKETKKPNKVLGLVKKILSYLGTAILAVLIIVVGWLAIDKFILGNPVPSIFGYSSLYVSTGSMQGPIDEGDMIIIKKTDDYKIGDIVTYLPEGYNRKTIPTTHRIIRINDDGTYVCKGDANNSEDPVDVKREFIIGEVKTDGNGQPLSVIEDVGVFVKWVKEGGGLIYVLAFVGILGGGIYLLTKKEEQPAK
jgi:signal peptidase